MSDRVNFNFNHHNNALIAAFFSCLRLCLFAVKRQSREIGLSINWDYQTVGEGEDSVRLNTQNKCLGSRFNYYFYLDKYNQGLRFNPNIYICI